MSVVRKKNNSTNKETEERETNLDVARKNLLSKYLDDSGRLNINDTGTLLALVGNYSEYDYTGKATDIITRVRLRTAKDGQPHDDN